MSPAERLYEVVTRETGKKLSRDAFTLIPLDGLDLDSLEILDLVLQVESEFAVKLPDADVAQLDTLGDLLAAVERAVA